MAKRTLKGDLKRIKNSPAARDLRAVKNKVKNAAVNRGSKKKMPADVSARFDTHLKSLMAKDATRDIGSKQHGPGTTAGGSRLTHFGTDCATCVTKDFKNYPSVDGLNF